MKSKLKFGSLFLCLFMCCQLSALETKSPIKYVIVICQENRSFDSYFGTYPFAPGFKPLPGTPFVNGIPAGSYNPDKKGNPIYAYRFTKNQKITADPEHGYETMMEAYNKGKMDKFYFVSARKHVDKGMAAMGHYDAETIPEYWNYAQNYSLADNWFQPVFGSSTPGALYLVAAQSGTKKDPIIGGQRPAYGPYGADKPTNLADPLTYPNIGDLLSEKKISWKWYQGGYRDGVHATHKYVAHHNPFQYFKNFSTGKYKANLCDYDQFKIDLDAGKLPHVVFVKAEEGENEHPGSAPAETNFSVKTIEALKKSKYWKDCLVILTFDESGGFWDHVPPPQIAKENLAPDGLQGCGPRIPALLISPYAKRNYVSHVQYDNTSILKFIEWNYGIRNLNNRDKNAANLLDMLKFQAVKK